MAQKKKYKKGEVTFRRIRGKIVPIKKKVSNKVKRVKSVKNDFYDKDRKVAIKSKFAVSSFTIGSGLGSAAEISKWVQEKSDIAIMKVAMKKPNPYKFNKDPSKFWFRLNEASKFTHKHSPKLKKTGFVLMGIGLAAEAATRIFGK